MQATGANNSLYVRSTTVNTLHFLMEALTNRNKYVPHIGVHKQTGKVLTISGTDNLIRIT